MKPGAILINTSRGELWTRGRTVRGTCIRQDSRSCQDVFSSDRLQKTEKLLKLDNFMHASHRCFYGRSCRKMALVSTRNLLEMLLGHKE